MQRAPKRADVYSTLGWIYYKVGKLNEAVAALKTAVQLGPVSRDTAYYAARVMFDVGNKTEARMWLNAALKSPGLFAKQKEAGELNALLNQSK